jgi:hypothetical protein
MPDVNVHCRTLPFGEPGGSPVDDVYVSIHPEGGGLALGSGTTGQGPNSEGTVFLGNLGVGTYEIRITPSLPAKVNGGSLQSVEVVASVDPLIFDVLVDTTSLEQSPDINLCRCSGTFKDPYGKAVSNLTIRFSESELPQLLHYSGTNTTHLVVPKAKTVRTDSSGFCSIDLIREQVYLVYLEGFENIAREIKIPDLGAAPLPDVIFPIVRGAEYTNENDVLLDSNNPTVSVSAGQEVTLSVESVFRSGLRVDGLTAITLDSSDSAIFTHSLSGSTLTITGVAVGVATLEVTRTTPEPGMGIKPYPDLPVGGALSVTVNP